MLDSIEQRKWQEERRQEDLKWRHEDLRWQAEQARLAEERWNKEHNLQRYQLLAVGIFGTIILAAAQILAALIQSGSGEHGPQPVYIVLPPDAKQSPPK